MEDSQPETEGGMSFRQKISQDFTSDRHLGSQRFQQGVPEASRYRNATLGLTLLNVALLITTVVIGVYCAKATDENVQIPMSALGHLFIERDFLRNQSHIVRATEEAEAALSREWTSHQQMKLQLKQQKLLNDKLQSQIEGLKKQRANLQSNKATLEETCGRCQPGWVFLKTACYYFAKNAPIKKNWHDSRADCIARGADLLVINSAEEQQRISNNYPRANTGLSWWENGYWMGLTDAALTGTWVWINNVTQEETMYWREHQPSHDGAQSGHCAAFFYYTDTMRTWYNANCQDHQLNWICEKEPKPLRTN